MHYNYDILNLNCAHCAKKIEEEINKLEEIEEATLIFPLKKLKLTGNINSKTEAKIQKICDKIEKGVVIKTNNSKTELKTNYYSIILLIFGVLFFILALFFNNTKSIISISMYLISYICIGYNILYNTFLGIKNKNYFDENFLMSIATIGAFMLGEYSEAIGVVLLYKIGTIFEKYAVNKSRSAISAISQLKIDKADVLINGEYKCIPSADIKIGDIIKIKKGDRIPVDAVIESDSALINTSIINGESLPVDMEKSDTVVSGYINAGDVFIVKATATAENSMMSKFVEAIENAAADKPKIDKFITRFSRIYTPIVLMIAFLTALIPSIITKDYNYWIYTALTFLIISCPCALVLSVPLAYFSGIGISSKMGILLKSGNSLEALDRIKNIIFDKTGTLTTGIFNVTNIITYNDCSENYLLKVALMCEKNSNHPIAKSICDFCENIDYTAPDKITEISGLGIIAEINNDRFLCGNIKLMNNNLISVNSCNEIINGVIYIAKNDILIGKIVVEDTIKPDAKKTISYFKKLNINTIMLTGDNTKTAEKVSNEIGVDAYKSELLPNEKLSELVKIRTENGASAFVGDGINDGIVLSGADVGISFYNGSDLAIEASDIVIMNDKPSSLITAKKIAKSTASVCKQNIIIALAIKILVIVLGLIGIANMWFAVFADSGITVLLALNSTRLLNAKQYK